MLLTTEDNYKYFLDGIKKEQTSTVKPFLFNRIANDAQDLWLSEKVTEIEINQKRIDDLEVLRVVTDGVFIYRDTNANPVTETVLYPIPPIVVNTTIQPAFKLPVNPSENIATNDPVGYTNFPRYYRLLNVMFKVVYQNDRCGRTGVSEWLMAKIMRSDKKSVVNNPYRKPNTVS